MPQRDVTEDALDELERARERLRADARRALGVSGADDGSRLGLRASGVSLYPLAALGLLAVVDQFQGYAFLVLGPEIGRALGIGKGALAAALALKTLAMTLAGLPMAAAVQRKPRRGLISIVTGFAWSAVTMLTGLVRNVWEMIGVLVADGASSGSVQAIHPSLLMDISPPEARVRSLSVYRAAESFGNIASPLMVAVLTAWVHLTWRGVFLVMGVVSVLATVFATKLRDPGYGGKDAARVREAAGGTAEPSTTTLRFGETVQRVFMIATVRRVLAAYAVLGMLLIPLYAYLFFFLEDRWGLGPGGRGAFFAAMATVAIIALTFFGRRGDRLFRQDPAKLVRLGALLLGAGVLALALSILAPAFGVMVALFAIASAFLGLVAPILIVTLLSVVGPEMRPHAAALAGVFLSAVGGFGGLLLLGGIDRRFGSGGAIVSLAVPGVAAALVLRGAARTISADIDHLVDELVERERLDGMRAKGAHIPMLSCRRLDVSYRHLQVLFGVDFAVDEGERVGLLGTNGAGKSTLLRAISGLALPQKGSVRFCGEEITYLDPERRVRLGISQIPGGSATFGPLSVVENLRAFAYTRGLSRTKVEPMLDEVFAAFPKLAERRDQRASTLSGGERQMLGLSQAFVLEPKLLLIDELSLGLAPKVVTELLGMVERIGDAGSAVVLVEQSLNVALSVVSRAYFMEKGEIRFDGPARELLERRDLLRSVYLKGVAEALR